MHGGPSGAVRERIDAALERELEALNAPLDATDPQLSKALSKTRRHVHEGAAALGRRVDAARARSDGTRANRVADVCAVLAPGAAPESVRSAWPISAHGMGLRRSSPR